jgi:uncharacterized membrane protein YobD (UPF0266 family)
MKQAIVKGRPTSFHHVILINYGIPPKTSYLSFITILTINNKPCLIKAAAMLTTVSFLKGCKDAIFFKEKGFFFKNIKQNFSFSRMVAEKPHEFEL